MVMCNDYFMNMLRKNKDRVKVFMTNEAEREGVILSFDPFCIILQDETENQILIRQNSISEIEPIQKVNYIHLEQ